MALWKHECSRVIADRFVTFEDKEWFDKAVQVVRCSRLKKKMANF